MTKNIFEFLPTQGGPTYQPYEQHEELFMLSRSILYLRSRRVACRGVVPAVYTFQQQKCSYEDLISQPRIGGKGILTN